MTIHYIWHKYIFFYKLIVFFLNKLLKYNPILYKIMDSKYKYLKYKQKYLELKQNNELENMIGGGKKIYEKKFKMVEFADKKIYVLNNIDDELLDDFSEFPIGSITKLFTIVSLLLLHQNKKINIYDNIGKYIDNKEIKDIKIIDIINHTSGLKFSWDNTRIYGSSKIKYNSASDVYEKWNKGNLIDKKLIGNYSYSDMGYHLLGVLIEKVSGLTYSDFVKENILIPLKMENTGIEDSNIVLYDGKLKKLTKYQKYERTYASSSGELKSCVGDLIKFSEFVSLLDAKSLSILKKIYVFGENERGFRIGHNGGISGGKSILDLEYDKNWKNKDIFIQLQTAFF